VIILWFLAIAYLRRDRVEETKSHLDEPDSIYLSSFNYPYIMARYNRSRTHAYSAKRSGSKKYAKADRRKRNKPRV
jgi:hypothetical protein